ncbi:MAG: hypothetical protein M1371_07890 [Actinobacteria bacterium]|nr:hypothetical protein [Actinomycetota bacterium]
MTTARNMFLNVFRFGSDTRTLNWEFGYWWYAVERWYKEGLPKKNLLIYQTWIMANVYAVRH